ncbi:hypothetical protein A2Y27_00515 [candidate division CPR2 bacterium GWD1_39_7]|nr:MAG: hypothetical protein A2Y27_00515 [candidate division CPR2 bacterium GWD1_39_7]
MKGIKTVMEDAFFLESNFMGHNLILGGVFDGHCGSFAANYASQKFTTYFKSYLNQGIEKAFENSYQQITDELARKDALDSGTTATTFLIMDNTIYGANVGDSGAIVITSEGLLKLTKDHRMTNPDEFARVAAKSSIIFQKIKSRSIYVAGYTTKYGLEPTRSLGDKDYRSAGIIPTPHTFTHRISDQDIYLIVATDGLWDFLNDTQVEILAREIPDPAVLVKEISKHVFGNFWGNDNLTIIAIGFKE